MHDIERFIHGFEKFQSHYFEDSPGLFNDLKHGQRPGTLLIGCCDSRVDPALLLGCDPGDIFTVRIVASLVPPCGSARSHHGVSAAIQFAVESLKVSRIIVLGHAQCGGIRALVEQDINTSREEDFIGKWMSIAEPARARVMSTMQGASLREQRRACELASILVSLKNLETFPWVKAAKFAGSLTLHGWYFDLDTGALLGYAPRSDAFLPLVCPIVPKLACPQ